MKIEIEVSFQKMPDLRLVITRWNDSGELGVMINGISYTYYVDVMYFPKIKKLEWKKKFKDILDFLKEKKFEYVRETKANELLTILHGE